MGELLHQHRLAGLGRGDDEAALPLADRGDDVDDAAGDVFLALHVALELEGLVRVQRREVLEQDLVLGGLGSVGVDLVDFHKREVALAVLGRADLALDRIAGVQVEASDLRGADVDVVGGSQVGRIGRAQEAEAVRQHFQRAFAEYGFAFLGAVFQQGKDQLLLAHAIGAVDLVRRRHFEQLAYVLCLEFG